MGRFARCWGIKKLRRLDFFNLILSNDQSLRLQNETSLLAPRATRHSIAPPFLDKFKKLLSCYPNTPALPHSRSDNMSEYGDGGGGGGDDDDDGYVEGGAVGGDDPFSDLERVSDEEDGEEDDEGEDLFDNQEMCVKMIVAPSRKASTRQGDKLRLHLPPSPQPMSHLALLYLEPERAAIGAKPLEPKRGNHFLPSHPQTH